MAVGPGGYVAAALARLGGRDPLAVLAATPEDLAHLLAGCSALELGRPEAPGRWSAVQVLAHLADSELVFGWRTRIVLERDRPRLEAFDENRWVALFRYAETRPDEELARFVANRRANLAIWRRLGAQDRSRVGVHAERGEETLDVMLRLWASHDLAHRAQLARILGAAPA